ncbi:MAG: serine/threonine protein kinase [Actinomycetota bacterium]|nr:serine/threonine protein kinase [Actinomycetota bacterium]
MTTPVDAQILPERYRSPKRIARGGMGEIYWATDATLGRAVAVKLLAERYSQDDAIRQRFTREALAAARLSGEQNIVTIFDVGEWSGRPFIVMEYLSGGSLDDRLRDSGAQEPAQALDWLEDAGAALDAAHRHGVVHRDVKPANLLLDRADKVHVADFGIARAAGLDSLTMTGTVLGTAGYLSPEQARGELATDASDRYALAVVAFELLSGRRPFESESITAEAAAHVNAPIPSIHELCENLPPQLDRVFGKAMAKDPAARYPTAAELAADLRHALAEAAGSTTELAQVVAPGGGPPVDAMPARSGRPGGQPRRPPVLLALGGLLLGAGALGAILAALLVGGDDRKRGAGATGVKTIVKTGPGSTVTERITTTTKTAGPPPPPTTTPSGGKPSLGEARRLVDQSTGRIRSGDYAGALPVAQRALSGLQGSGDIYEAYANYNIGTSLIHLGRCGEGLPYLDRSQAIQGHRSEFDRDRALCKNG